MSLDRWFLRRVRALRRPRSGLTIYTGRILVPITELLNKVLDSVLGAVRRRRDRNEGTTHLVPKNAMPEPFVSQTQQPVANQLCYTEA